MNKAVLKKKEKIIKTTCPFCYSPLKEEFGLRKCKNENCSYKEKRKVEQVALIK